MDTTNSMMHVNAANVDYLNSLLVHARRNVKAYGTQGLEPLKEGVLLSDRFAVSDAQRLVLDTSKYMNHKVMQIYEELVKDCREENMPEQEAETDMEPEFRCDKAVTMQEEEPDYEM